MKFSDATYLDFAIQTLCPNAEYTFNDADYSTVNWIELEGEAPTESEIEAQIVKLKANFENEKAEREAKRKQLLERLGITEEEAKLLLG